MQMALQLWAANHALMTGWQISGPDWLGMPLITDQMSPLYGTVPAPRVLQNQLDRKLEAYIARIEKSLLTELSRTMLRIRPCERTTIFLAVIILLHVRERDIWRLQYWVLNHQGVSLLAYYCHQVVSDLSLELSMATSRQGWKPHPEERASKQFVAPSSSRVRRSSPRAISP